MTSDNKILNMSEKEQKEILATLELYGRWLELFGKGLRLCEGLNDLEKGLMKKYTEEILTNHHSEGLRKQ